METAESRSHSLVYIYSFKQNIRA